VATKRVKRSPTLIGLTPAAIAAWRVGDVVALRRETGLIPGAWSPTEVLGDHLTAETG
jgi:hypothetical protein